MTYAHCQKCGEWKECHFYYDHLDNKLITWCESCSKNKVKNKFFNGYKRKNYFDIK